MSATVFVTVTASATEALSSSDPSSGGDDDDTNCGTGGGTDSFFGLRVASIFIILVGSMFGAMFPVFAYRSRLRSVIPKSVFDFAKYFGSGVIIATAFIHLLDPALDALGSPCLGGTWQEYPWALALSMFSIFFIFFVELFAFRWGTAKLKSLGLSYDAHGHGTDAGSLAAHGPEGEEVQATDRKTSLGQHSSSGEGGIYEVDEELKKTDEFITSSPIPQIIGIFILEFGILLHSVLIGLTLAVDPDFKVLFVVLVFHQMFEGLGLGSRLAYLKLPTKYNHVAYIAALLYGLTTPIGIAAGLGVRSTYNPDSKTASIVSGIMDALSSGVLIYTGLVELLAHEFLFSPEMNKWTNRKLAYACTCMLFGAGIMSLLGRWA